LFKFPEKTPNKGNFMMNTIAPKRLPNEDWDEVRDLWEGFLENYRAFKSGKMLPEDDDKYKLLSSPGPTQYSAFADLFGLFKKGEEIVNDNHNSIYTYDLVDTENTTARPMLEFLQNLCSPAYDVKGKNIVIASGSFWEQNPGTRKKIISCLEELHGKGANVSIFARAKETEPYIKDIIEPIKKESRFGLKKRIPIHFIKADKDFVQLEFPHTESSLFRLTMFLDLKEIGPDLKDGKTKEDLSNFFDKLTRGVL
jgi:hypothetical protein